MRKLKINPTDIVQLFNVVQENAAVVNCPFFDKEIEVELECRKCYFFRGVEQGHVLCVCPGEEQEAQKTMLYNFFMWFRANGEKYVHLSIEKMIEQYLTETI